MSEDTNIKFSKNASVIISILSSVITITQFVFAYLSKFTYIYIIPFTFLIFTLFIISKRNKISEKILKVIMNSTCPDKIYKLTNKEIIYEFKSETLMRHEKRFCVDVLHDGFSGIADKFKWTGKQQLTPTAPTSGQEIEMLDEKFGMQRYKIKFKNGNSYSKSDKVPEMIMCIENIEDIDKVSSKHLSCGIFEITDHITLHLIFDNKLTPKNIRKLEYIHYTDDEHYKCIMCDYTYNKETEKKEIIWEIDKPFFGGKYMIDWSFD